MLHPLMQWHDYLALALFVVATIIVSLRAYRAMFGQDRAGCGSGCGSCGSNASASRRADQLLTIGGPPAESESR